VEGDEKRLAVECDGDRYRSLESLSEDTARQSILERLGWQFVRIRGSAFYRDPDMALRRVFDKLDELGITPTRSAEASEDEVPPEKQNALIHELEALRDIRATAVVAPAAAAAEGADAESPTLAPKAVRKPRGVGRR
jgi:hypothetical protein